MMPVYRNVGDKVIVTKECIERMRSSNRSCVHPNYPTTAYINSIEQFVDQVGTVTHTFKPQYEVCVTFGNDLDASAKRFHMKDCWMIDAVQP